MIGKRIKSIRVTKGLSQEFVAEHLGINQSTLARMEMGNPKLDSKQLISLCEVLEIDLEELIGFVSPQKINQSLPRGQ